MKKILFVFAVSFCTIGCTKLIMSAIPNELKLGSKWKISQEEFKQSIKSVLILNVYTDSALIPFATSGFEEQSFDNKFRETYYALVNRKKNIVDKTVNDAFKNGTVKIRTVELPLDNNLLLNIKKDVSPLKDTSIIWPNNYDYSLNPDFIKELAKKYSVDAVFFQYLQVYKDFELYYWTTDNNMPSPSGYGGTYTTTSHSLILPIFKTEYKFIMYDRNGGLITRCPPLSPELTAKLKPSSFGNPDIPSGTGLNLPLEMLVSKGDGTYYARKLTVDEISNKSLDKRFTKNIQKILGRKGENYILNDLK
jgi:hypothetical protein